jgi:hypothetical protein
VLLQDGTTVVTGDTELLAVMRALLSRPERWSLKEVPLPYNRLGYRLTINGSVVLDKQHATAVAVGSAEEEPKRGGDVRVARELWDEYFSIRRPVE